MKAKLISALFFCIFGLIGKSFSQDLHYSQFYNAPLVISPALTGIFNGDERFMVSFRDQGRSIPVPYLTFSGGYDRKIYPKNRTNGFFGAGLFFNYDKQGDSQLRLININLSGSYTHLLNDNNLITIGGLAGYSTRGFDPIALTWDSQWDTATNAFNASLPSGETFDFESFSFIETALGLNYRWQKSERTKIDLGVGAFHVTKPNATFSNSVREALPMRLSFYGIGSTALTEKLDLQLDLLYQTQEEYRELLFGGYLNFYFNQERGRNRQFRVGAGYKTTAEVLFVKAGVQINEWFVAASYDIDMSDFAGEHEGAPGRGPEVHLRYIIKHVKPQGKFKICPIF